MTTYRAGTYLCCTACGHMLRIDWPTRSIVCSCGQRVTPPRREPAPLEPTKKKPEAKR